MSKEKNKTGKTRLNVDSWAVSLLPRSDCAHHVPGGKLKAQDLCTASRTNLESNLDPGSPIFCMESPKNRVVFPSTRFQYDAFKAQIKVRLLCFFAWNGYEITPFIGSRLVTNICEGHH
jgi:hypothetical protein